MTHTHKSCLLLYSWNSMLVCQSHSSPESVSVQSPTSFHLNKKLSIKITAVWLNDGKDISFSFSFSFLQVASGPDQKGSGRHWRVQTNGSHVRKVDRGRAPPTQRTEIWSPVMILSSLHRQKQHPVTGVPPEHTSTHPDGPLRRDTAAYSPQSSSFTLKNLLTCEDKVWHLTEASMWAQGLRKFSHLKWCEFAALLRGFFFLSSCTVLPFHTSTIETRTEI